MSTALSKNSEHFLTLKQASEKLDVSIETLLSWNQHNILKPTITTEGEIGYTTAQVEQFLKIRQLLGATNVNTLPPEPARNRLSEAMAGGQVAKKDEEPFFHQTAPLSVQLMHEKAAVKPVQENTPLKASKPSSTVVMLSFSALLVVLGAAFFAQQDLQTHKLKLSGPITSTLPVQLKNESALKKDLAVEGENISEQKITAPTLYSTNTEKAQSGSGQILSLADKRKSAEAVADTYASVSFNKTGDEDAAIDESGNIKGDAMKPDALAAFFGNIDEMVKSNSIRRVDNDILNQLLMAFAGTLALYFFMHKQLAFPMKRPVRHADAAPTDLISQIDFTANKALEVMQKTDGTVVLAIEGKEYKVSKPELNSESDQFIETLMTLTQTGMKEIEYDTFKAGVELSTPLSRLVTRLGFVGIKRDLFFPRTSKNSVLFRKYLTQKDLDHMNLTTSQIIEDLAKPNTVN